MTCQIAMSVTLAALFIFMVVGSYANYQFIKRITERQERDYMLVSTATMIKRLEGLLGTKDLTAWEQDFVRKLAAQTQAGQVTQLTGAQVDKLDELHGRHFA